MEKRKDDTMKRRDVLKSLSAIGAAGIVAPWEKIFAEGQNTPMLYREFGKTGKKVSLLGLGGGFDYYKAKDGKLEECAELAVYAYEKGINFFDSGKDYAAGKSEEIFGMAFKEMDKIRKSNEKKLPYYFSTKSLYENEQTGDQVLARIEEALKNFGKDKIDFFYMWAIMDLEQYKKIMVKGGPYEGALKAKERGLIDHLCFSTHASGEEIETIIHDDVFEGILLGYNIINFPRREKGLIAAGKKKIGVAVMNPLAGGLIPSNKEYFSFLKDPEKPEKTEVQSALSFVMNHPQVSTALSGMKKKEEIDENVHACSYVKEMNEEELAVLKKKYLTDLDGLCTTCKYSNVCPLDIHVFHLMDIYNYYVIRGKEYAKKMANVFNSWYSLKLEEEIGKCIKCRLCEQKCTQKLPIMERFEFLKKEIFEITS